MPGISGGNLYIGQDNIVFWGNRKVPNSGLYDNNTESFVEDASVAFVLKNSAGNAVSGGSGSCTFVSGTKGCYEGVLEDAVSLTENSTYYLEVTATCSSDRIGFRRIEYTAKYRTAN